MFRFLIAAFAVCVFSIASAGVAEAGGSDMNAGGGKGGGKATIEVTNTNPATGEDITVFYRATENPYPADVAELNAEFSSVVLSPGETETITIGEGMVDFVVGETASVDGVLGEMSMGVGSSIPGRQSTDPFNQTIDVMDDEVTEIEVRSDNAGFGFAIIDSVTTR